MLLTEDERRFLFSLVNDQYQNWNFRSVEGPLLESLLSKLHNISITLSRTENSKCQYLLRDMAALFSRLADSRLQFIIQGQSGPGSGVGSTPVVGAVGGSSNGASTYFNASLTYDICNQILRKLDTEVVE